VAASQDVCSAGRAALIKRGHAWWRNVPSAILASAEVTVSRQVQRAGKGDVEIRPPKYGSEQSAYLADGLVEALAVHVAEPCPGDDPARWLFGAELPPYQSTVGYWWRRACMAAAASGVKLHDLRHFYASGFRGRVRRRDRPADARPKSATVTLTTFAHLWPTAEDHTRVTAGAMLTETLRMAGYRPAIGRQRQPVSGWLATR
jgi:hypothetical protein